VWLARLLVTSATFDAEPRAPVVVYLVPVLQRRAEEIHERIVFAVVLLIL
jgi:hypothetical protein